jgi:hypothetical protein
LFYGLTLIIGASLWLLPLFSFTKKFNKALHGSKWKTKFEEEVASIEFATKDDLQNGTDFGDVNTKKNHAKASKSPGRAADVMSNISML